MRGSRADFPTLLGMAPKRSLPEDFDEQESPKRNLRTRASPVKYKFAPEIDFGDAEDELMADDEDQDNIAKKGVS